MAKQCNYSTKFKRQVVLESLAGETLYRFFKRCAISDNVIRLWIVRYEADGVHSPQAFQKDPVLLFGGIPPAGLAVNITYMLFGRLARPEILAHLRFLRGCDEPEFLPWQKTSICLTDADGRRSIHCLRGPTGEEMSGAD